MEDCFTPKFIRRRNEEPISENEPIPVPKGLKEDLRRLKNQGLPVNEMTRDYFKTIIDRARDGQYEHLGVKLPGRAS